MEKTFSIKILKNCSITDDQIKDLLSTAFEGGISYWCQEVNILVNPSNSMLTADVLINGGVLEFVDAEDDTERWNMSLDQFLLGVKFEIENNDRNSVDELMDDYDADVADNIIQYALFGKLVFC